MSLTYPSGPSGSGDRSRQRRAVLAGVLRVAVLLVGAPAALLAALAGIEPGAGARSVRRVAHLLADAYRDGRDDVIEADVINEEGAWR